MKLLIEDRAAQAYRHLQPFEAKKVSQVIHALESEHFEQFRMRRDIYKLSTLGEQVFVLRATPRIRMLVRYSEDHTLVIEDIASHDALQRFLSGRYK